MPFPRRAVQAYKDFNAGRLCKEKRPFNSSERLVQSCQWYREAVSSMPDMVMPADYCGECCAVMSGVEYVVYCMYIIKGRVITIP